MNTRKTELWKPIDYVSEKLSIGRATLYRWIKAKRIKVKKDGGFTHVDFYACEEEIRKPRRSRGRMLVAQKLRKDRFQEQLLGKSAPRKPKSIGTRLGALNEALSIGLERRNLDKMSALMVIQSFERTLPKLKKYVSERDGVERYLEREAARLKA